MEQWTVLLFYSGFN